MRQLCHHAVPDNRSRPYRSTLRLFLRHQMPNGLGGWFAAHCLSLNAPDYLGVKLRTHTMDACAWRVKKRRGQHFV